MVGTDMTTTMNQFAPGEDLFRDLLEGMGRFVSQATLRNEFPSHLTTDANERADHPTEGQEQVAYAVHGMRHAVKALLPYSGPNPNWSAFTEHTDQYGSRVEQSVRNLSFIVDKCDSLTPTGEELVGHAKVAANLFTKALEVVKDNVARMERGQEPRSNFDMYFLEGVRRVEQAAKLLKPSSTQLSS